MQSKSLYKTSTVLLFACLLTSTLLAACGMLTVTLAHSFVLRVFLPQFLRNRETVHRLVIRFCSIRFGGWAVTLEPRPFTFSEDKFQGKGIVYY